MNKPIKNVTLQFPCTENWNSMESVNGERMCSKCHHKVVDFTTMSEDGFNKHLRNSDHVCGRFRKSQLSTTFLKYAAAAVIAAAGASGCETVHNNPNEPGNPQKEVVPEVPLLGIVAPPEFHYVKIGTDTIALPLRR